MGSQRHGVPVTKKQIDKAVEAFGGGGKKKRKREDTDKKSSSSAGSK